MKVKDGGGHGGHNGLKSIFKDAGVQDFVRVRVGIGRPPHGDAADYVLSPFGADERHELPALIDRSADAVETLLSSGFKASANEINGPTTDVG